MPVGRQPHLAVSLELDPYAPRAARHLVRGVDSPSPDLRDAVSLLTSEIVTRAVRHAGVLGRTVELRVWMPSDIVRVELRGSSPDLFAPEQGPAPHYEHTLLDEIADRWSIEAGRQAASIWFEIDRLAPGGAAASEARSAAEKAPAMSR
jgi:hypothetical protein